MKFDQDFIEKVREASNLVDIIGQFVQLKRSSNGFTGLCPFHNEKSPSFSVSEEKQVYHCFGCKASGNVYTFMQNYQGMTFPEAVEYLARRANIAIPEQGQFQSTRDQKSILHRVNALAVGFYQQRLAELPSSHPVHAYLQKRGLTAELVETFKLGFAPDEWSELSQFFESKKVPVTAAEEVGLLRRRGQGKSGHYDLFRNRLMFPIFSPLGQCLGFGGRVLANEQPKYLNSPDSIVFHKGKVFYGLNHAAKFIRSEDYVIVVEGYMDWLALVQAGIQNVVATLGTALTHDHAKLIKRYSNRVVILFDGDNAGRLAAVRSLPILLSEGLLPRGLFLPDNLDPDDFIKAKGGAALKSLIESSQDLFDVIATDLLKSQNYSPTSKVQAMDELAPILVQTQDVRLRQIYSRNLAEQLGVELKAVEQSVKNVAAGKPAPLGSFMGAGVHPKPSNNEGVSSQPSPQIELKGAPPEEIEILNLALAKEVYLKEVIDSGVVELMNHSGAKKAMERMIEVYGQMPSKFDNLSALLAQEAQPAHMVVRFVSEPLASLSDEAARKLIHDCIKRVREKNYRAQYKQAVSNLRGAQGGEQASKLEQIMNIQKSRRSLNRDS